MARSTRSDILSRSLRYTVISAIICALAVSAIEQIFGDNNKYDAVITITVVIAVIIGCVILFIELASEKFIPPQIAEFLGTVNEIYETIHKNRGAIAAFIWLVFQTLRSLPFLVHVFLKIRL